MEGTEGYEGLEDMFLLMGAGGGGREKGTGPSHTAVTFFLPVAMGIYTESGS